MTHSKDVAATSLWDLAAKRAARNPHAVFASTQTEQELTFAELMDQAEDLAAWLELHHVSIGESVVWQLPTSIEAIVLAVAISRLGLVQIPVIPMLRGRDLSHIINQTTAAFFIVPYGWRQVHPDEVDHLNEACRGIQIVELPVELPRGGGVDAPAKCPSPHSWIFYTSGTTAKPKGVRHSESTLMACAGGVVERYAVTPLDRVAIVFQITHIGGIAWIYAGLFAGCRLLLIERFDRAAVWDLRRQGVTLAGAGVPFFHEYLAAQESLPHGVQLFPLVRAFTSGGMSRPPGIHYEMKSKCGSVGVLGAYGLTEAPILTAAAPTQSDVELATTEGPPMRGVEFRVVREDGSVANDGEVGELRVRAPQVMLGYVDTALNSGAFDDHGFLRTGDLGFLDGRGNVVVDGRLKDVIIRKGENISAKEVEDALFMHPSIIDASVIGLTDVSRGEMVCAVVVTSDRMLDVAGIAQFLRHYGMTPQKIPERVEIVSSLPRNSLGKVDKNELRRKFT
jgi:cyclohexanecarboxylate-CoA ligase